MVSAMCRYCLDHDHVGYARMIYCGMIYVQRAQKGGTKSRRRAVAVYRYSALLSVTVRRYRGM
jgi:hypothetical protein